MAMWTFEDPALSIEFKFKVNPREGGSFKTGHNIHAMKALRGRTMVQQGRPKRSTTTTEGVVLSEAGLASLTSARYHTRQLRLTDDLGRETWVIVDAIQRQPAPRAHHPHRSTVTLTLSELDYPD